MAVHDVDVEAVRALALRASDRVGHVRVVRVEDADGDARPTRRHGYSPTPAGNRLVAALATQGVGALVDEPCPPPGDDGWRRLAGPLGRELAARRPDLLAAVPPDRGRDPGVAEDRREPLDHRVGRGRPGRMGDRVHRDEVDVGVVAAEQLGHGVGVDLRVVDPVDHRRLVGHPPAGRGGVLAGCLDDLGDGPAPVQRHEHVAERIARRVERDRQRELRAERGQPPDPGHDARGRHRDVPGTEPEPTRDR